MDETATLLNKIPNKPNYCDGTSGNLAFFLPVRENFLLREVNFMSHYFHRYPNWTKPKMGRLFKNTEGPAAATCLSKDTINHSGMYVHFLIKVKTLLA